VKDQRDSRSVNCAAPLFRLLLATVGKASNQGEIATMAQRVQVLLVCDLHEGENPAEETVSFSVDGSAYEIDVCKEHAAQLRDAFAPYVGAGRRSGGSRGRTRRRGTTARGGARGNEVREWARQQGIKVSERGRIPSDVYEKFDAAHR
jgi:hypothetical protein